MLKTLQWYITRELVKTFALTAFGLTLVFSLCGGVLNMLQAELLSAVQVMRILMFILPLALTLTLPVSALLACAIVYGRFAADNEFDACKASGVNIHRLLAPALALSILTTAFTFSFANYVLPRFAERLEAIVRSDIQKIITQALTTRGYVKYGPYVLHARHVRPDERDGAKSLYIQDAAFLMLEKDTLVRCGTAKEVEVRFDFGQGTDTPLAKAVMLDVVGLDLGHNQLYQWPRQPFNPMQLPRNLEEKPKYLTLARLFEYYRHPTLYAKLRDGMNNTKLMVRDARLYRYVVQELNGPRRKLVLEDARRRYEITTSRAASHSASDFRPDLYDVVVTERWEQNRQRVYKAERCSLRVKRGYAEIPDVVHISLSGKVSFVDSVDPGKVNEPRGIDLEDVQLPAHVVEASARMTDADLLGADLSGGVEYQNLMDRELPPLGLGDRIEQARVSLRQGIVDLGLEVSSIIHSRLAFSASTLVMLVLAAGLAIIFRGGQLLTAFVISFVPGLLVVVLNIMGRQMAEKVATHLPGIAIIWAGIVLLAVADVVVLMRYLKR